MSEKFQRAVESAIDRTLGSRLNAISQAGAVTFLLLAVLLVTGAYMFLYYSVEFEDAYDSMRYLNDHTLIGGLMRGAHRFAADLVVITALIHMIRGFALRRFAGPRRWPWASGVALFVFLVYQGITGYILPWDERSQAIIGVIADNISWLPVFEEPPGRFFIVNDDVSTRALIYVLASHLVPPVLALALFWAHFRKTLMPRIWPDKPLLVSIVVGLLAAGAAVPAVSLGPADFSKTTGEIPFDWTHLFALPVMSYTSPPVFWGALAVGVILLAFVPPLLFGAYEKKVVALNGDKCVGCWLCEKDCPYRAISMRPAPIESRHPWVAVIDERDCVGCGVCVGSCGFAALDIPGVSAAGVRVRALDFIQERKRGGSGPVVVYACENAIEELGGGVAVDADSTLVRLTCAGQLYSGWVEEDIRRGAAGVVIARCAPWRCESRLGSAFTKARLTHERKPWLKKRFPGGRLRIVTAGEDGAGAINEAARSFKKTGGDEKDIASGAFLPSVVVAIFVLFLAFAGETLWHKASYALDDPAMARIIVSFDWDGAARLAVDSDSGKVFEKHYEETPGEGALKIFERIKIPPGARDITVLVAPAEGAGAGTKLNIAGPLKAGTAIVVRQNEKTGSFEVIRGR